MDGDVLLSLLLALKDESWPVRKAAAEEILKLSQASLGLPGDTMPTEPCTPHV